MGNHYEGKDIAVMSKLMTISKNNLKLMLRNKVMIIVIVVASIMVIAALSNAFHSLLDEAESKVEFEIGYVIDDESKYKFVEEVFASELKDQGINATKYGEISPEKALEEGAVDVFIVFGKNDYQIYGEHKNEIQVRSIQHALYMVDKQMSGVQGDISEYGNAKNVNLDYEDLECEKTSGAMDYYGKIEIIYFLSICGIFFCMIIQAEKNNNILSRFRVGNVSNITLYFGKLIPCFLVAWVTQVLITGSLATVLYDIKWGCIGKSFLVLTLEALAFSAFGFIFFLLFNNIAVSLSVLFAILWAAGFVGGTFETYMYSGVPDSIKELSPLYYINRTLVEFAELGRSEYFNPCVLYMLGILLVSVPVGIILMKKGRSQN